MEEDADFFSSARVDIWWCRQAIVRDFHFLLLCTIKLQRAGEARSILYLDGPAMSMDSHVDRYPSERVDKRARRKSSVFSGGHGLADVKIS